MRLFFLLILVSFGYSGLLAQPACVECCCGSPEEIGFPCGTFEEPPLAPAGGWIDYGTGQTYCGWTVVSGTISIHHGGHNNLGAGNPNGSSQHLDLNGSSPGTVERTLTGLQAGSQYTITLWYAAHNAAGTANCRALVNDGALLDETWSTSVPGSVDWEEKCLTFISDGPSVVLKFIGTSNNGCCGMLIDDMNMWECTPDTTAPTVAVAPEELLQVPCSDPLPPVPVLDPDDDCDTDPQVVLTETNLPQPCFYNLQRTWVLTDACGNSTTLQQIVEVRDIEAPELSTPPANYVMACGGDYQQEFEDWLLTNGGGGFATDNCDNGPIWTVTYPAAPDGSCGSVTATFTVTDDCGNQTTATATFSIGDIDPPVLVEQAGDVTVYCLSEPGDSLGAWLSSQGGALAVDPCGPVQWSNDFDGDTLQQAIIVTFTATDACGNAVSTTATFSQVTESDTTVTQTFTCDPLQAGADTVVVSQGACESVSVTLTVLQPSDTLRLQSTTCDPATAGKDTLVLQNGFGCDSLVIREVTLLPSSQQILTLYSCDPGTAGKDTLLLQNQYGCDSIVYLETVYTGIYQETEEVLLCGKGTPYSDTVLVATGPCDSLFITEYSYKAEDTTFIQGKSCDPSQAGLSVQVYSDAFGCDSTVIVQIALLPSDSSFLNATTCEASQAGVQQFLLQNRFGCDSLVTLNTMYVGVDTQFLQLATCDPAQAGTKVEVVPGTFCDTVRVISYSLLPSSIGRDTVFSCASSGPPSDTLLLTNFLGCDSVHITIFRYGPLEASAEVQNERCAGSADGRIVVTVTSGNPGPFTYRLGAGAAQQAPVFSGLPPGVYQVIVQDGVGCTDTLAGLSVQAGETLLLDAGADRVAVVGELISLSASATPSTATLTWTATDPLSCNTCALAELGPLTVSQTVTVSGLTAAGCTASDQLEVILQSRPRVYIPNSFSPDNNGINDIFSLFGNDQVRVVRHLAVYDRWGNALFSRSDLPVNDPSAGWDGSFRGQVMDPGVYVFAAEVEFLDGWVQLYKGDVTLVR